MPTLGRAEPIDGQLEQPQPQPQQQQQQQASATARLVIEDPRLSDEALYKCDVTYVKGKCPSISLVKLQMMMLPSKAQIIHQQQSTTEGQLIGPFAEHEQLQLTCLVYGGRPQPKSVIWRKIDALGRTVNLMSAKYSTKVGRDLSSNLLELDLNHTLTSADLGAKFECHVEHEALEQAVRVRQTSVDSLPTNSADSTLDLHPAKSSVSSETTSGSSLDSHVFIDLNVGIASVDLFLSKVNRRNSSEPAELLREGDLVELECVAYNSRPPANISWFNGAEPIEQLLAGELEQLPAQRKSNGTRHKRLLQRNQVHQNADGHTYDTHSHLSIRLSRHEHRAQIQCRAQNSLIRAGQPLVKTHELQVQHAPIVLMEPAAGIQVNEYQSEYSDESASALGANIYCIYSANPSELTPNSTRWFKDSKLLVPSLSGGRLTESLTATGYPVLSIRQVNRSDAGAYECQVMNGLGASERLPASEQCRLEVNYRPSVRLRIFRWSPSSGDHLERDSTFSAREGASSQVTGEQELEPHSELVQTGNGFMLNCDVLDARPAKIQAFHWYKRPAGSAAGQEQTHELGEADLLAVTDSSRFLIHPLASNFAPSNFACSALNSLGSSKRSNQILLQLSYTPGPSFVRPVSEPALRKAIVISGRPAHSSSLMDTSDNEPRSHILHQQRQQHQQPIAAGRELLLECITLDLGQPRANTWLWFKNGQPIDSWQLGNQQTIESSNNNPSTNVDDKDLIISSSNPITGQDLVELPLASGRIGADSSNNHGKGDESLSLLDELRKGSQLTSNNKQSSSTKLISSGRYLFISSIQLNHKGNYSCVAVNRLGSSTQQSSALERDSYRLGVALAPSFVQPLAPQTYWPEVQIEGQLELVCQVQCEPICQLEWLKNGELMDLKSEVAQQSESQNYVTYQESQTILDENLEANQFKSVKSKLILQFHSDQKSRWSSSEQKLDRAKLLERRAQLSGVNYTCQSSPNFMGPSVRSTTKFIVQYPPENVLISSPNDKLSFVEGSNGPRLNCGASGEPQVQYRWFLLRGTSGDLSIPDRITRSKYDLKRSTTSSNSQLSPSSPSSTDGDERNPPTVDQVVSKAFDESIWEVSKGLNGSSTSLERSLIELAGSATEQVGGSQYSSSSLDLSNLSLDRRQAGHYVCEASNRLGQTRQSVYVDVLYKPTCTTLHLHSLDLSRSSSKDRFREEDFNVINTKPFKATVNDEYPMVRETNEDFIHLRKILVLSPLIRRNPTSSQRFNEELSFRGSIFDTIFKEKRGGHTDNRSQFKSTEALIHSDDKSNNLNQPESLTTESNEDVRGDSWGRFNMLLLKLLNGYMKKIKTYEEQVTLASDVSMNRMNKESRDKLQNRRSTSLLSNGLQSQAIRRDEFIASDLNLESRMGTKNLLTFACMARDANPMSNLTFDWSFGSLAIPETIAELPLDMDSSNMPESESKASTIKPLLVYVNSNYTLHITLVRRLDTYTMLNPFQLSLVTLNVMLSPLTNTLMDTQRSVRQSETSSSRASGHRTPAYRQRYQSERNSLKANLNNNNIQSNSEMDSSRPYDSLPSIDLDEQNWQEQLGNLLKCRVTNQIGTSDVCHVRVNIAERLKSQSSPSEFAKWRMPSLASKSLLIISILIGCTLIVFVTFALLAGPYIKEFSFRKEAGGGISLDDNKSRQSKTNCQKSSVLGLLGNGDTSTQGSSDDDISARLNHIESRSSRTNKSLAESGDRFSLNFGSSSDYRQGRHLMQESQAGYDKPRDTKEERLVYHGGNFIDSTPKSNYRFHEESSGSAIPANRVPESLVAADDKSLQGSTASRLLANLKFKSLSKFKTDRISDLSNFASRVELVRNLHTKNVSSSETTTTGLSASANDSEHLASPVSTESPTFFDVPILRHNQGTIKRSNPSFPQQNQLDLSYQSYNQTSPRRIPLINNQTQHLNSRRMIPSISSSLAPAYSNMITEEPLNAMDEFIRQREVDHPIGPSTTTAFYRSHSVRNEPQPSDQLLYQAKNDLNQYCPTMINVNQTGYYHTHHHQAATLYRSHTSQDARPPVLARTSHRTMLTTNFSPQHYQAVNNRLSMPVYDHSYPSEGTKLGYLDTIDSHLNRLAADSLTAGFYPNQSQQIAYANTLDRNSYNLSKYQQDEIQNQSVEHIYDVNAYATPEQTPLRRPNSVAQPITAVRPRVSQLIQTFNSKAPE